MGYAPKGCICLDHTHQASVLLRGETLWPVRLSHVLSVGVSPVQDLPLSLYVNKVGSACQHCLL